MALGIALWAARPFFPGKWQRAITAEGTIELVLIAAFGLAAGALLIGSLAPVLAPFLFFLAATLLMRQAAWRLTAPGAAWLTIQFLALGVGWFWTCLFIDEANLPYWVEVFALLGLTAGLGIALLGVVERIAREAVLTHEWWQLPVAPANRSPRHPYRVSIHLCCYAEPPEVVKQTIDRLAALDYDNFEVLVCDNNTKDEALWRPLEEHCQRLNAAAGEEKFRFFHVDPLPGAKAGALNFCLEQMDPATEIVGVIDADYYSEQDFLSRLLPFFDDARVGYVQTPHDYRDYENSAYLTASYWEYMPNNKVDMPGVSEYGGAFTIGTMCLLRARVLRFVGGWAEWCLTEDSEVSVRLRAAGFSGIYLRETFGRGLIPDSFDDYKKQRFRWTAGPVQQLLRHWRLFLPSPWARPMPGWTKLLEVLRCIAPLQTLVGVLSSILLLGGTAGAIVSGAMRPVDMPNVAWVMIGLAGMTWLVRTWHRYRLTGCRRINDMIRGEVARASLTYVILLAGVAGLSSKPLAWRRTPKFGANGSLRSAIGSAFPETLLGLICLALVAATISAKPYLGSEFTILASIALSIFALRFFAATYMAMLAVLEARKEKDDGQPTGGPIWDVPAVAEA
jgi:cellulose synthase/poly-beta-1,6-N-acetylglucosamine synthase-like glycosyltransferase